MKTTLITLLLSITLFSCSEYSDDDYLLLEANYEASLQRDKDAIADLRAQLNSSNTTVNRLNQDINALEYAQELEREAIILDFNSVLMDLQTIYVSHLQKLEQRIAALMSGDWRTEHNELYYMLNDTILEYERLYVDYQDKVAEIAELKLIIESLGG